MKCLSTHRVTKITHIVQHNQKINNKGIFPYQKCVTRDYFKKKKKKERKKKLVRECMVYLNF